MIVIMALFEVTIAGSAIGYYENDEGKDAPYLTEDTYMFLQEGSDLIETMMAIQPKLDALNEALRQKHPEVYKSNLDWEFKIVGLCKTELIRFNDTWIKEYVEQGVISRNYKDEDDD